MLRGEVEHQLDDRARVAIPKAWRQILDHGGFLTRGWYGCLFLLPWGEWLKIEEKLAQLRITDIKGDMVRVFFSGGVETWLDKQGRILVPSPLRQYAGIDKDVVVRGVMNRIEIWSKERWQDFQAEHFAPERIMAQAAELDI
jgi:MraZ protein